MPGRIEDYAIIGNCETLALVGRNGSIDWLCLPRFDSDACFAALLGGPEHGRWLVAPRDANCSATRRYSGGTLILETEFETPAGAVLLTDFMVRREGSSEIMRIVKGLRGSVAMRMELIVRFNYGSIRPWVSRQPDGRLQFIVGPDRLLLATEAPIRGEDFQTVSEFELAAGDEVSFSLNWSLSYRAPPASLDAATALASAKPLWAQWAATFKPPAEWGDVVLRSLLTLKALAHWETGGIVAAGTTSLPEKIGGNRNWDYRYCWLRDATFTLYALVAAGFLDEAKAWREWLVRVVGGSPDSLQTVYGVAGDRRLEEFEIADLPGYEGSKPVRVGNAAVDQRQLDLFGEVLDALYVSRKAGLAPDEASWALECALLDYLEKIWREPDDGLWEMRGEPKHFTHSKVMCWVAFDRGVRSIEEFGMTGPLDHWRKIRATIHRDVCERGFDREQNAFVQSYGSTALDAATLLIPMVGFLPADDPRVKSTVAAIERKLIREGFVIRYDTGAKADGLPPGEGVFLACSFWLADNYILLGRRREARELFERVLAVCNDVGLLAEEYDPIEKRQLGNFPQGFSHLALINTAHNLASSAGPVHQRSASGADA